MKKIDIKFIKFLLVGVANTVVGTSIMFILYNCFHANYWFSSAANYIVGSILSYFLNKHFTFKNKQKSVRQIIYFIVNITICYILAYGIAKKLVLVIFAQYSHKLIDNLAMLSGMVLFTLLNYFGQRYIIFKE